MRVLMAYLASLPCPHPHSQEDGRSPQVGAHHGEGLQGSKRDCLGQDLKNLQEQRPRGEGSGAGCAWGKQGMGN